MWDLGMSQYFGSESPLSEHPASPALLTSRGPHRHAVHTREEEMMMVRSSIHPSIAAIGSGPSPTTNPQTDRQTDSERASERAPRRRPRWEARARVAAALCCCCCCCCCCVFSAKHAQNPGRTGDKPAPPDGCMKKPALGGVATPFHSSRIGRGRSVPAEASHALLYRT